MLTGSIRTRLIALVGVVAVPLIGVVVWMSYQGYQTSMRANGLEALNLAGATQISIAQFMADADRQLGDLADHMGQELVRPETCGQSVAGARALASFVFDVAVFAPDGRLICTTRAAPEGVGPGAGEPRLAAQVLGRDGLVVGDPMLGAYSGQWVIPLLTPIHDPSGGAVGVLAASVAVERFQALLAGVPRDPDALITITSASGAVVARSTAADDFVGDTLPTYPNPGEEVSPNHWLSVGTDFNGTERQWGRVEMPELAWRVYAGLPISRVRGPALADASRRAAVVGVILALALIAGILIRRGIAGSLVQLHEGVRSAAAGGVVAIPPGSPMEVREVGEQLNRTLAARDEAQATAQAAQARFLSILENSVMGIFISAGEERFLHVNPALADMLGYASTEELERLGPRDLFADGATRQRFEAEIEESTVFRRVETQWLRKDGSRTTVELTGQVLKGEAGEVLYEVHAEDVTARRRFEREIQQTQKMEAVGRLAGGVAHDFNNLLTVISGNLLLALEEPALPPGLRGELGDAHEAADRAAALTRKLLAFSRKDRPEPQVVNADDLVGGIQRLLGRLIPERIELVSAVAATGVGVVADPGQLEQVVMNLVLNARDAIKGTGRITLSTSVQRGLASAPEPEGALGWFVLEVQDTGVGMTEEVRSRVFEPFFTTKGVGEGTGLGLATVHAVVDQAGGHVSVESWPGRGTRFTLWLPAVSLERTDDATGVESYSSWAQGETILVIEDEASVRLTVRRILERVGYEVITARDGREGVAIMESDAHRVDLVLCDVVMPVMGGVEVSRVLSRVAPEVPFVFMSGYTDELPVLPASAEGVSHFIGKPFTPSALLERIRAILGSRGGRPDAGPHRAG